MAYIVLSDLWKDVISVSYSPPSDSSTSTPPSVSFDLNIEGGFRGFYNCPPGTYQFTNNSVVSPSISVPSPLPSPAPVICWTLDSTENKFIPSSDERIQFFTPLARGGSMNGKLRNLGVIIFQAIHSVSKPSASSSSSSSAPSSTSAPASSSTSSKSTPKYLTTEKTTFISSDLDEIDSVFKSLIASPTIENQQSYTRALRWYYVHDSIMQENKEFYLKYADKIIEQIKSFPALAGKQTAPRIWYDYLAVDLTDLDEEMQAKGKILKKVIADAEAQSSE